MKPSGTSASQATRTTAAAIGSHVQLPRIASPGGFLSLSRRYVIVVMVRMIVVVVVIVIMVMIMIVVMMMAVRMTVRMIVIVIMMMQALARPRAARVFTEHQRFNGHRHGVGRHADAAEIDVVEIPQHDA